MLLSNQCMMPINSMPMLVYDILFFVFLIPFVVCGLYYSNNGTFACLIPEFSGLSVPLYSWLRVDSWVMLGYAISCIISVIQLCICLATYCSYVMWIISRVIFLCWRLAWLIVGSVLFWKHLLPGGFCDNDSAVKGYMWANLIIGFIHILLSIIFFIWFTPQPFIVPQLNMIPPPPTAMITTVRGSQFPGQGYAIGTNQAFI